MSKARTKYWIVAKWRSLWRLCPECNSDAPYRDNCPVCACGAIHKDLWWGRWVKLKSFVPWYERNGHTPSLHYFRDEYDVATDHMTHEERVAQFKSAYPSTFDEMTKEKP